MEPRQGDLRSFTRILEARTASTKQALSEALTRPYRRTTVGTAQSELADDQLDHTNAR
jgi:hypothetical protein